MLTGLGNGIRKIDHNRYGVGKFDKTFQGSEETVA